MNVVCDNALLTAFSQRSVKVAAPLVEEAAKDLGLSDMTTGPGAVASVARGRTRSTERSWFRRLWSRRERGAEPEYRPSMGTEVR